MDNQWWPMIRAILVLPLNVLIVIPFLITSYIPSAFEISKIPFLNLIGYPCLIFGFVLLVWTIKLFVKIGTGTLAPWAPTKNLVVLGPYQYTRNPMITGVLGILIGESLVFSESNILIWATVFFTINHLYFILSEEPGLEKRFGQEYLDYKEHVPRWIPKIWHD